MSSSRWILAFARDCEAMEGLKAPESNPSGSWKYELEAGSSQKLPKLGCDFADVTFPCNVIRYL